MCRWPIITSVQCSVRLQCQKKNFVVIYVKICSRRKMLTRSSEQDVLEGYR